MRSSTLASGTSPAAAAQPLPGHRVRGASRLPASLRQWWRFKILAGGVILLGLILVGLLGPLAAPFDPNRQSLNESLVGPQWFGGPHALGTDNLGRDIFSRLISGARISLLVACSVVLVAGGVGFVLGAASGYCGGRVDFVIQKAVEVAWAFPSLLLAIAILAFLGQSLTNLILALVARRWIQYCRLIRAECMALRQRDFITAARVLGASGPRIIRVHLLPNLIPTSVVMASYVMALSLIAESSLSFLGLGVPPIIPTWGSMLAEGRSYVTAAPWLSIFPGLCIFVVVLGINLLGDGLRDVLDPRMRKIAIDL
jgi:peptide/nickel transport system permease protein